MIVKLCGHGTLAASHFLFTYGLVNANKIEFLTLFGVLIAKRVPESQDCVLIELDLPIVPLSNFDSAEVPSISKALSGASVIDLKITTTEEDLIVMLLSGKAVTDLQPQFDEIQRCNGRAVIITGFAPPGSMFDFFSRVFGPKMGINEDLVTGSAHCAIASYWSKKLGKCDFVAYQASARGGILNLHLDEKTQRVLLQGKAITVMEGWSMGIIHEEPTSQEDDKRPICDKWYQSQPRSTVMGMVRGTYTKPLHCGVCTKGGVRTGRVHMSGGTDKYGGMDGNVPLTWASGTSGDSMSRTDLLDVLVLHQTPYKCISL
ncbi:hypothetical protein ACSBR1_032548 [Camellia fascicularis]